MIISDDDDAQKIKDPPVATPTVRYPPAARRPFSSLPDYETSQALAVADLNDSQVTLYKPPSRRRIIDSRFWRAAIISLAVYIFLTLVIGVPIILHKDYDGGPQYPPYNALAYSLSRSNPGPYHPGDTNPSAQGFIPVCNNWTMVEYREGNNNTPIVLAATQNYVSPCGQISISSNTSWSSHLNAVQGAFYTGVNPNQTVQDAVLSITMQASSPGVFSQTSTCFAAAGNFTELFLYVPDSLNSSDSILYNITLLFPQNADPHRVHSLSTSLPVFDQHFTSFDNSVTFDDVSIQGPASRVTVDSIQANTILVDTSLEPVTGTFSANTSLFISTIMASIVANISLYNGPNQNPTLLDVHTGNGNLTANVTMLTSNTYAPQSPNFVANLRTFSGSLSSSFLHDSASSPAAIQLCAFNDLGSVDMTLDSLFEGSFQVSTIQAYTSVTRGNANGIDPWDPGLNRTMAVNTNSSAWVSGWIGWGGQPIWSGYKQGGVVIDSSLANVTLLFLG